MGENGYFHGKYCSKNCTKRLDNYIYDIREYPQNHQRVSGSDGNGFFESLNSRYGDLLFTEI